MNSMSYVFFGLMLIPLLALIVWLVKQDKKKAPLGLVLLAIGIVVAAYVIVKYDSNFILSR